MIEQLHAERVERAGEPLGQRAIRRAWRGIAARMVVGHHDARAIERQHVGRHRAHPHVERERRCRSRMAQAEQPPLRIKIGEAGNLDTLGGKRRERVAALRYLASGDAERDAKDAARLSAEGYVAYKIKIGAAAVPYEIERTRRICAAVARPVDSSGN